MKPPLHIATIWHMHQPYYKDLLTGEYLLPWVRLHAAKDYYDILTILDDFPNIKQTFNLVPSLCIQMEDYINNNGTDKFMTLTLKDPEDLDFEEKTLILKDFFMCNWSTMVKRYPRYYELLLKRGRFISHEDLVDVAKRFTDQEYLDLQTWFNLAWFGHIYKTKDPVISELIKKGRNFSTADKVAVIEKQKEIISKILPKYKELQDRGQIEVSTTPFYHPIMPLVCNTNIATMACPQIHLPKPAFQHPEDVNWHIQEAVKYMESKFGRKPKGMWPSEGSVSEEIIPIVASSGIKWIATDEDILAKSLGRHDLSGRALSNAELYQPYMLEREGEKLSIVFRDRRISDDIGFVYYRWSAEESVRSLISHLTHIHDNLPNDGKHYLVSIILDGENPWEYYWNNGYDFLVHLYSELSKTEKIRTTTVSDFIEEYPPHNNIHHLFAGSWINHNFGIWIGHSEDNTAWSYLKKARDTLSSFAVPKDADLEEWKGKIELAWQEIYIAEGSDWNWWYGDDHSSANDHDFDELFRKHLKNVYTLLEKPYPKYLDNPIKMTKEVKPHREPSYLIKPTLDGISTNYYEWLSAGFFDVEKERGAMHQAQTIVKGLYYGFDLENLYVRFDFNIAASTIEIENIKCITIISEPVEAEIELSKNEQTKKYDLKIKRKDDEGKWLEQDSTDTFALAEILEIKIPFEKIGIKKGDDAQLSFLIKKDDKEVERWPKGGVIPFKVPTEDFELEYWMV